MIVILLNDVCTTQQEEIVLLISDCVEILVFILDCVLHHSHVVQITGKSYRLKDYYSEDK